MQATVQTDLRIDDPDSLYETLVHMHEGLDERQSHLVNARLILLLANHIGDRAVVEQAIRMAREGI